MGSQRRNQTKNFDKSNDCPIILVPTRSLFGLHTSANAHLCKLIFDLPLVTATPGVSLACVSQPGLQNGLEMKILKIGRPKRHRTLQKRSVMKQECTRV